MSQDNIGKAPQALMIVEGIAGPNANEGPLQNRSKCYLTITTPQIQETKFIFVVYSPKIAILNNLLVCPSTLENSENIWCSYERHSSWPVH